MGRLIDIDVLFDYFGNDAIGETTRSNIEYFVSEKGTVDAIPKADYENRLKADLVAMLTDIQMEIDEQWEITWKSDYKGGYKDGCVKANEILQEKINSLKEGKSHDAIEVQEL